ncbi:MAG: hypothetical protein HXY18_19225 [Bryobacteraceae bacterium]|nr:hypothetical protein [Bryobacteraceae bacterium]
MSTHVRVLAWLNIAMGFLGVGLALLVFAGGAILPAIIQAVAPDEADIPLAIVQLIVTVVTGVILTLSLPCLVLGFGLYNFRPWARVLGLVLAALNLLNVPLGTALSLYAFWVLLKPESEALFKTQGAAA